MKAYIKDDFTNLIEFREWSNRLTHYKTNPTMRQWFNDAQLQLEINKGTFGKEVDISKLKKGIQEYDHLELIDQLEASIERGIESNTAANSIPSKKLAYNDLGLGVFSFDRAAQGMYQLMEFYSPTMQRTFDRADIAEANGNFSLKADNSAIIHRLEQKGNGLPKVRTNNKKVFAYFPKVKRQRAAVEIFVSCGNYSNVSAEDFLYSGMVAVILAKKLIKASIPVKINTVIGWTDPNLVGYTCAVVPLKNYDEPLDVNLLALATSDPRFWRYEGYKACANLQLENGFPVGGAGLTGEYLKAVFEENEYRLNVPNRFYFGRVTNKYQAIREINKAMEQVSNSLASA